MGKFDLIDERRKKTKTPNKQRDLLRRKGNWANHRFFQEIKDENLEKQEEDDSKARNSSEGADSNTMDDNDKLKGANGREKMKNPQNS